MNNKYSTSWRGLALFLLLVLPLLPACTTTNKSGDESKLTVGTVQRHIKVGMSGADVAAALGSPNIVTTDEQRREVWIYDRLGTQSVTGSSGIGWSLILVGGGSGSTTSNSSQKTLTVIIKFDDQKKVRDFAYHTSRF